MLVLTRKIGETIRIGDNVTVRVLALRGGQVSLGFTAPSDVRIFREEVLQGDAGEPAAAPDKGEGAPRNGAGRHG
jgi:carbon storage regulator